MSTYHRRRVVDGFGAVVVCAVLAGSAHGQTAESKRVDVQPFDQMAVAGSVEELFGGTYDLGRGIAELVRERLMALGVIAADAAPAEGTLTGTIVYFGKESGRGEAAGVSVGGVRVGLGRKKEVALVMLEARLLDVATGQVVTVVAGQGKSDKGGWDVAARTRGGADLGSVDLSGDQFTKSAIGDATHKAVDELAQSLAGATRQLGTLTAPVAAAPVATGGVLAAGGPIAGSGWLPYQFRGTEHFRYDVTQTADGESESGSYQLDLQSAGEGRVRIVVAGQLGEESYSSSVTTGIGPDGMQMGLGQFMGLGPVGMTLLNPAWWVVLSGRDLTVGDGWTYTSEGETTSVRVERSCQHAGHSGVLVVFRDNQAVRQESCIARDVALPLRVMYRDDDESAVELTLASYRP